MSGKRTKALWNLMPEADRTQGVDDGTMQHGLLDHACAVRVDADPLRSFSPIPKRRSSRQRRSPQSSTSCTVPSSLLRLRARSSLKPTLPVNLITIGRW